MASKEDPGIIATQETSHQHILKNSFIPDFLYHSGKTFMKIMPYWNMVFLKCEMEVLGLQSLIFVSNPSLIPFELNFMFLH